MKENSKEYRDHCERQLALYAAYECKCECHIRYPDRPGSDSPGHCVNCMPYDLLPELPDEAIESAAMVLRRIRARTAKQETTQGPPSPA